MKFCFLFVLSALSFNTFSIDFPNAPHTQITPGSLCDRPDSYRYREQIPYCERSVSSKTKQQIFSVYRNQLGYRLDLHNREDYKIDHFIPLCAGGSNEVTNLWPQHVSIFTVTDPVESLGCEKLSAGKISQMNLVRLIRSAKLNLSTVPQAYKYLQTL